MSSQSPLGQDKSGYLSSDTIAALASAPGGAIAIVRVSGPRAFETLGALIGTADTSKLETRKLFLAKLMRSSGPQIDEALCVRFVSPDSFTGEDVVEYQLHGGSFVCAAVLEELQALGVRQALPGEFSFRAVRNGKMSLSQAQAVADLIAASSEAGVSLALEKMSGTENRLITSIAETLRRIATLAEAGIDFSDQDIDEVSVSRLSAQIEPVRGSLARLLESYGRGLRIMEGARVSFVGLPNAGKSSFFNALLGEDRSIVSHVAGTTRDIVKERITLRGKAGSASLLLEDTAGLRKSEDLVESLGIERSFKAAREADLVLFLLDPMANPDAAREQWAELGVSAEKVLGIITKSDLASFEQRELARRTCTSLGIARSVLTSSLTAEGISEATEEMISFCSRLTRRDRGEVVLTRLDHARAVGLALSHLDRAKNAAEAPLFSADLRQSLAALAPLIGETLPDDILGRIFSEFCIGK